MSTKPETKVVNKISTWLKELPECWHFKVHGGPFQMVGVPDIVGCLHGSFFAIEVKVGNNEPTEKQKQVIELIRKSGGTVGIAYSLEDVKKILEKLLT